MIPGARNPEQARANAEAGALRDLGDDFRRGIREIYDRHLPGRRALPLVVGWSEDLVQQREERRRAATTRSRRLERSR